MCDRLCCHNVSCEHAIVACWLLFAGKQLLYEHLLHIHSRDFHALYHNVLWSRQALLLIAKATSLLQQKGSNLLDYLLNTTW